MNLAFNLQEGKIAITKAWRGWIGPLLEKIVAVVVVVFVIFIFVYFGFKETPEEKSPSSKFLEEYNRKNPPKYSPLPRMDLEESDSQNLNDPTEAVEWLDKRYDELVKEGAIEPTTEERLEALRQRAQELRAAREQVIDPSSRSIPRGTR
jgi:cell division protein FtsN